MTTDWQAIGFTVGGAVLLMVLLWVVTTAWRCHQDKKWAPIPVRKEPTLRDYYQEREAARRAAIAEWDKEWDALMGKPECVHESGWLDITRYVGNTMKYDSCVGEWYISDAEIAEAGETVNGSSAAGVLTAGSGPETCTAREYDNPEWLRNHAINALALAARIEQDQKAAAAPKITRATVKIDGQSITFTFPPEMAKQLRAGNINNYSISEEQ